MRSYLFLNLLKHLTLISRYQTIFTKLNVFPVITNKNMQVYWYKILVALLFTWLKFYSPKVASNVYQVGYLTIKLEKYHFTLTN